MGRKPPSISQVARFNLEDSQHNIKRRSFYVGSQFTNDEEEGVGNIYVQGQNVLEKEIEAAK